MSDDPTRRSFPDTIPNLFQRSISRRQLVTRSATLALTIPFAGGLLAACEADDADDTEPAAVVDDDDDEEEEPTAPETDDEADDSVDDPDDEEVAADDSDDSDEVDGDAPARGGTIVVATQNDWSGFDPHRQSSSSPSIEQIYNTLTFLEPQDDDSLEVVPELATDWELADDHAIFHLRDDVTFHDGSPFNAEVVQYNIERLKDDQSFGVSFVETIESVDIEDEFTARFNLSAPTGPLLSNMSSSADGRTFIISKEMGESAGDDYGSSPETTAGTGPMRLVEWVSGSHDIVERTGEYWENGSDGEPLPYFERQRSEFTAEDSIRALSLRSGDVDIAGNLAPRDVDAVADADDLEAVANPFQTASYQYTFSTEYGPFHDNQDLRLAIAYGINRQALADVLGEGIGEPMRWFLSPGHHGYDDSVPYYEYDPDMARQYLESAGYPDGLDTEVTVINREIDVQQAEMLEQMLGEIGIRLHLDVLERLAWIDKTESLQFEFATYFTGVRPDSDSMIGARWGCGSGRNQAQLCDEELQSYLDAGRESYDDDERAEAYIQAQTWIYETGWYGVMWYRPIFDGYSDRVQGRTRTQSSPFYLRNAWVTDA